MDGQDDGEVEKGNYARRVWLRLPQHSFVPFPEPPPGYAKKPFILPVSSLLVGEITQFYAAVLTGDPYFAGVSGVNERLGFLLGFCDRQGLPPTNLEF
jgi:hypothetical protein